MDAYFVQIENNLVINIILVPEEQAHRGSDYLNVDLGFNSDWVHFDLESFEGIPPSIGGLYNRNLDRFSLPRPYPSWIYSWDEEKWFAPIPKPDDTYEWDEATQSWVPTV